MKSVKFFSFLMSCGIFLAAPSFAMDSSGYGGHCDGCSNHIHELFLQDNILKKVLVSMRYCFLTNSLKIDLFKDYFNRIDFSEYQKTKRHSFVFLNDDIMEPIIDKLLEMHKGKYSQEEKHYLKKKEERGKKFSKQFLDEYHFLIFGNYKNNENYYELRACHKNSFDCLIDQDEKGNKSVSTYGINVASATDKSLFQVSQEFVKNNINF